PCAVATVVTVPARVLTYQSRPTLEVTPAPGQDELAPMPVPATQPQAGTFEYNGGPRQPIPMPGAGDDPQQPGAPQLAPPVDPQTADRPTLIPYNSLPFAERLVSLTGTKKTGKWSYPAYGEVPTRGR